MRSMLLYVHVPFCRRKCGYCAFYSKVPEGDDLGLWERGVAAEAKTLSERHGRPHVETLYFGGGTPTLLPIWLMERVVSHLRRLFDIATGAEFTVEGNPESVDSGGLRDLISLGVNRLSLGVQSLDDGDLKILGRPHTASQALSAFEAARMAGFRNISLDFIWGLPGQRLATWRKQLRSVAMDLKPEHVSCYSLTREPGTPLAQRLDLGAEAGGLDLPDEEELARMFVYGSEYLEEHGYLHYEISNFARMGFVCRHNTGYWEGRDYLGLGPSAVSTVAGRRWENPRDLAVWSDAALAGRAGEGAEELDAGTRAREMVMLSLRTSRGLSYKAYRALTGRNFQEEHAALLKGLRQHGLVRMTRDGVRLARSGMLVSNLILERLMGQS